MNRYVICEFWAYGCETRLRAVLCRGPEIVTRASGIIGAMTHPFETTTANEKLAITRGVRHIWRASLGRGRTVSCSSKSCSSKLTALTWHTNALDFLVANFEG